MQLSVPTISIVDVDYCSNEWIRSDSERIRPFHIIPPSMAGNMSDGNSGDTNGARTILMGGGGGGGGNTGLVSLGGGGGGVSGVDIHIHLIVTNAGMGGVGDGFNTARVLGPFSPVISRLGIMFGAVRFPAI